MAAEDRGLENKVYKIFTEDEWNLFQACGRFSGSSDDIRDGFIHLSTREQLAEVIGKFFAGKDPLYVAEFSVLDFHGHLKWEMSGSGKAYPHLYGVELLLEQCSGLI